MEVLRHVEDGEDEVAVIIFSSTSTELLQDFTTNRALAADAIQSCRLTGVVADVEGPFLDEDMFEAVEQAMKARAPGSQPVLVWLHGQAPADGRAPLYPGSRSVSVLPRISIRNRRLWPRCSISEQWFRLLSTGLRRPTRRSRGLRSGGAALESVTSMGPAKATGGLRPEHQHQGGQRTVFALFD